MLVTLILLIITPNTVKFEFFTQKMPQKWLKPPFLAKNALENAVSTRKRRQLQTSFVEVAEAIISAYWLLILSFLD